MDLERPEPEQHPLSSQPQAAYPAQHRPPPERPADLWAGDAPLAGLCGEDLEILAALAAGKTDRAIAEELDHSVDEITQRIAGIYTTLRVGDGPADPRMVSTLIFLRSMAGGAWDYAGVEDGEDADPPVKTAYLDLDGVIVWVDRGWEALGRSNGGDAALGGVGCSYLEIGDRVADEPSADQVGAAVRVALSGDLPAPVRISILCATPGTYQDFDVLVSPRQDSDGALIGAAVALSPGVHP